MKQVKFNTGGQPVFLDDLKQIQDNSHEGLSLFMDAFFGGEGSVYLVIVSEPPHTLPINGKRYFRGGNFYVFYRGDLYNITVDSSLYDIEYDALSGQFPLVFDTSETLTDQRTLENGSTAYCRTEKTGTLYKQSSSEDAYMLRLQNTLLNRLKYVLNPLEYPDFG